MNLEPSTRGLFRVALCAPLLAMLFTARGLGADVVEELQKPPTNAETAAVLSEFTQNPNAAEAHANNAVVYGAWNGPALIDGIPPGFKVIGGDIVVPEAFGEGGVAATYNTNLWPDGIIPYEFDPNVTPANAAAMLVAMTWWENVAAVDFVPRGGVVGVISYVHIQNSTGNNSAVGMVNGIQFINIFNWNTTAIMAHELGHALGYWHEQSRLDSSIYVTINYANVCQNCCSGGPCNSQFQQEPTSDHYGPYDFDSVMQYGRCSFSTNAAACNASCPSAVGETLVVNPPYFSTWHCAVGQRTHLSYWDTLVMSFMYARADWRFQRSSLGNDLFFPGDFFLPYSSFSKGYDDTPPGGTLWILEPSTFAVGPVLDKPMTIGAPLGGVTLTR